MDGEKKVFKTNGFECYCVQHHRKEPNKRMTAYNTFTRAAGNLEVTTCGVREIVRLARHELVCLLCFLYPCNTNLPRNTGSSKLTESNEIENNIFLR